MSPSSVTFLLIDLDETPRGSESIMSLIPENLISVGLDALQNELDSTNGLSKLVLFSLIIITHYIL